MVSRSRLNVHLKQTNFIGAVSLVNLRLAPLFWDVAFGSFLLGHVCIAIERERPVSVIRPRHPSLNNFLRGSAIESFEEDLRGPVDQRVLDPLDSSTAISCLYRCWGSPNPRSGKLNHLPF